MGDDAKTMPKPMISPPNQDAKAMVMRPGPTGPSLVSGPPTRVIKLVVVDAFCVALALARACRACLTSSVRCATSDSICEYPL